MKLYNISLHKKAFDTKLFIQPTLELDDHFCLSKTYVVFNPFCDLSPLQTVLLHEEEKEYQYDGCIIFPPEQDNDDYYTILDYYIQNIQSSVKRTKTTGSIVVVFPPTDESTHPLSASAIFGLQSLVKGVGLKKAPNLSIHGLQLSSTVKTSEMRSWLLFLLSNRSTYCIGETFYL